MALSGPSVGLGYIEIDEMLRRASCVNLLTARTVERLYRHPYDKSADFFTKYEDRHRLYAATPHAASFGISFYVGGLSKGQQMALGLENDVTASDVIAELFTCLECLQSGSKTELRERFWDEACCRSALDR